MPHLIDPDFAEAVREFEAVADAVNDVDTMQEKLCEIVGDESQEFGKALVNHFPVEDGMPTFGDVQDFTWSWDVNYHSDDVIDRICQVMELIYAIHW